jgi:hypothetical protein
MDLSSTQRKHGISFYLFLMSLVFFIVFRAPIIIMIGPGGSLLVVPMFM